MEVCGVGVCVGRWCALGEAGGDEFMAEGVHEVQDSGGAHWIPPGAGEGGEMGDFVGGDRRCAVVAR